MRVGVRTSGASDLGSLPWVYTPRIPESFSFTEEPETGTSYFVRKMGQVTILKRFPQSFLHLEAYSARGRNLSQLYIRLRESTVI